MKTLRLVILLCLAAVPALAQVPPVVNPGGVSFTASPDHDAVANGIPVVARYTLDIATVAAPTVAVKTVDMGKPTPVSGTVTFSGLATVTAALPVGDYVGVVKAEGPGGVSAGAVSDPFSLKPRAPAAPGKAVWR